MTICSICGAVKRNANHWWRMKFAVGCRWYNSMPFDLHPGRDECLSGEDWLTLCGEDCLAKAESSVRAGIAPRVRDAEGMPA